MKDKKQESRILFTGTSGDPGRKIARSGTPEIRLHTVRKRNNYNVLRGWTRFLALPWNQQHKNRKGTVSFPEDKLRSDLLVGIFKSKKPRRSPSNCSCCSSTLRNFDKRMKV
ncbi:hypothetical protein AVEN_243198-1 [Araneus ventricosus]|uniref:Uncharacterized protein n=1 Tax=Araneus ventricosus TaxID=182803 RepID=A0A4Y2EZ93_ARAVE|nr:hypothetical protein AVEN_243198-1 [Araneus ventricosus]